MDFNDWLSAQGFDPTALTDKQKLPLQAAWRAEQQGDRQATTENVVAGVRNATARREPDSETAAPDPAKTFRDVMAAAEAESVRIDHIRQATQRLVSSYVGDSARLKQLRELHDAAIADQKMDGRSYDLALVRFDRAAGPIIVSSRQEQLNEGVLEAAVCRAGGLKTLEKDFDDKTLSAVDKRFKGGIGLHELIGTCAESNGFRGNVRRNMSHALRAAFQDRDDGFSPQSSVGPSTLSISGILSNVANKFVREAFVFVEDSWRQITAVRPVSDFKTITTYSLTGDLTYEKVAPGGEIKEGTLGEQSYTNKADTYGKILGIDRTQLVNDDLSALASTSRRLGRGGALKINDVFWTKFLNNSTFFTALRGNYDDGASDTLMDETGLANAHTLFTTMTDPDGKPNGSRMAIVLVPPQLWRAAWKLLVATPGGDTTATVSPYQGMFRLVQSTYLANISYTGYSTKAWYGLADPNDLPVIEMVFLNGQQMPTIETAELEFNRLGIAMRGFHDFGAELQEYRGGVKMKGEA